IFKEEPVLERVAAIEAQYRKRLPALRSHPRVGDVRWLGSLGVVELREQDSGYFSDAGPRLQAAFLERGILLRPLGPVLYLLPPYAIQTEELEAVFTALEEILDSELDRG
ncbi:MAG: aminotransferase class III-fold pyridoxal phosphate-dependent enzyme, partial [Acidobacteriota bacterium]